MSGGGGGRQTGTRDGEIRKGRRRKALKNILKKSLSHASFRRRRYTRYKTEKVIPPSPHVSRPQSMYPLISNHMHSDIPYNRFISFVPGKQPRVHGESQNSNILPPTITVVTAKKTTQPLYSLHCDRFVIHV